MSWQKFVQKAYERVSYFFKRVEMTEFEPIKLTVQKIIMSFIYGEFFYNLYSESY